MTARTSHRAAVAADGLTVGCLAVALWLLVTGPYRDVIAGTIVIVRWTHALFAALAIGTIRHAAVPSPSLRATVERWRAWIVARPALLDAVLAFLFTRPIVLLIGVIAVVAVGFPAGVEEPGSGRHATSGLAARFDANWYASIAIEGYDWQRRFDRQQNIAFFPAYPLLMRGVALSTGAGHQGQSGEQVVRHFMRAGLAISLVAFFWAAWYFARIAREELDDRRARDALLLLASYPFAVFFSAAYTESLFLLAALGSWYSLRHGQIAAGSLWGLVAGLARPNGFFLSVPLGLIALGCRDGRRDGGQREPASNPTLLTRLVIAASPVVGMLMFTIFMYFKTGVWFAWAKMHAAWGRVFTGEVPAAFTGRGGDGLLPMVLANPYDALNLLGVLFAFVMLWPTWKKLGLAWSAYILINMVPPLFAGGLLSMGRLSATMFPLFIALGAILSTRAMPGVIATFGMFQGLAAILFYTWRSLY